MNSSLYVPGQAVWFYVSFFCRVLVVFLAGWFGDQIGFSVTPPVLFIMYES